MKLVNFLILSLGLLLSGCILPAGGNGEPYGTPAPFQTGAYYYHPAPPIQCVINGTTYQFDYDDSMVVYSSIAIRLGNPCNPLQVQIPLTEVELSSDHLSLEYQGETYEFRN